MFMSLVMYLDPSAFSPSKKHSRLVLHEVATEVPGMLTTAVQATNKAKKSDVFYA